MLLQGALEAAIDKKEQEAQGLSQDLIAAEEAVAQVCAGRSVCAMRTVHMTPCACSRPRGGRYGRPSRGATGGR